MLSKADFDLPTVVSTPITDDGNLIEAIEVVQRRLKVQFGVKFEEIKKDSAIAMDLVLRTLKKRGQACHLCLPCSRLVHRAIA